MRPQWAARVLTCLAMMIALLGFGQAWGAPRPTAVPGHAPPTVAAAAAVPAGAVTFVGIGGLRWSDIDPAATPALWELTQHSAVASLAVRTIEATTCPLDGWLTINSGSRATGPRPGGNCTPSPPALVDGSATVPHWDDLIAGNAAGSQAPRWGQLAGPGEAGSARCGIGPGAAIALAGPGGAVAGSYVTDPGAAPAGCRLLVADSGALPESGPERAAALRRGDQLVSTLAGRPDPGTFVLAGISDSLAGSAQRSAGRSDGSVARPAPTVLAIRPAGAGYDPSGRPWLRSPSTRRTGLVQLSDLTPTLGRFTGAPDLPGGVVELRPGPAATRDLLEFEIAARTVRQVFVPFFVLLVAGQVLLFAAIALRRRAGRMDRFSAARATRVVAIWFAAVAPASFVANLLPWPRSSHPAVALWTIIGVGATLAAGFAVGGPWRRRPYGPAAVIGGLTALGLAYDVATGSRDQLNALFGLSPLIAGRFYGFGNITFAVYAMCALTAATWVGARLVGHVGRRVAAVAATTVAAGTALVDGWPGWGTDLGGVLSLLPGAAVLGLGLAGVRLRPSMMAAVATGTAVLVSGLAYLDWRRPPAARSHLGRFVQSILERDGPGVLADKARANLSLFRHVPGIAALAVLLLVAVVAVIRRGAVSAGLHNIDPPLRSLGCAAVVTALLGLAVNDSGVIVPVVATIAGFPLLTSIWAQLWLDGRG